MRHALLALPALAAVASLGPLPADAATPDWLKQLESQPLPPHDEETAAVQLLDDTELTLLPDGSQRSVQRSAFRILRREGNEFGIVTAHYDKDGKVVRMKGWGLPRSGKPFEVDMRDAVETALVPGTEASLITTARMKVLSIPAANPGNIVGYEIETLSRPVIVGEVWSPQSGIPVVRARYTLKLPPGWNYKGTWFNGPAVAPVPVGPGVWQWELGALTAIKGEAAMPGIPVIARHMALAIEAPQAERSSFPDWHEMGRWYGKLLAARSEVTPEVTRLVAARGNGQAPLYERIRALSEAVQKEVRYVQVTLDATGYQPRSPQDVLGTGYGDCKDKANALRLALEQIGVRSHLVLVNTNRGVVRRDALPSAIFNHAVLAIQLPRDLPADVRSSMPLVDDGAGNALLLFDPTDELTPFGRIPEYLRSGELLLVGSDGGRLVTAPAGKPADNGVDRLVAVKISADGSLAGEVHESWRGVWASREREKANRADQSQDLKRPVEQRLAGAVANYRIDSASVANRSLIDKPFEWQYTFSARDYAKVTGDLLMVRPRVLGSKSNAFLETGEPRVNAVSFDVTHVDSDVIRLEIPPGYEVETLPEAVSVDIGFAAYRSRTSVEGRVIVYERRFEQKELDLPLERVGALRELYAAIDRDERSLAVLNKPAAR